MNHFNKALKQTNRLHYILISFLLTFNCTYYNAQLISCQQTDYFSKDSLESIWRTRSIPKYLSPINNGVTIYRISYYTQWVDGSKIVATGSYLLPDNNAEKPTLIYNHGTRIKKGPPKPLGGENILCLMFASDNYQVISPDYIGLGEGEKEHLYCHVESEARAGVDLLKAINELKDSLEINSSDHLFITGYSQGGHAAMSLHKVIERDYNDEFKITASAPMSGPYNVSDVQVNLMFNEYQYTSYLPYLLIGLNSAYQIWDKESFYKIFASPYDTLLPKLFDGKHSFRRINKELPKIPVDMLNPKIVERYHNDNDFIIHKLLEENDVSNWKPIAPMQMCFCEADKEVSYKNAIITKKNMDALGANNVKLRSAGKKYGHGKCAGPATVYSKFYFDSFLKGSKKGRKGPILKRIVIGIYKMTHQ